MLNSNGVRQAVKAPVDERQAFKGSWELIQIKLDSFWNRWIVEYLPIISRRSKWFSDVAPIKEGSLVVVANGKVRNQWTRGRVCRTYPGKDGAVRLADVETTNGTLSRRAVCNLAILDVARQDKIAVADRDDADSDGRSIASYCGYGAVEQG